MRRLALPARGVTFVELLMNLRGGRHSGVGERLIDDGERLIDLDEVHVGDA
jgi:hypothetical protein